MCNIAKNAFPCNYNELHILFVIYVVGRVRYCNSACRIQFHRDARAYEGLGTGCV